jgi:cobyrinic acid a,c-diamide synthase
MDEAFCFYYEDNLDLLKEMGASITFFSPIHDPKLPEVSRIILGGGYPELHAGELSQNASMKEDILRAANNGMPILAECGGFMYLQERLSSPDKETYEMVGVLKGSGSMRDRLGHFGYVTVRSTSDNPYLKVAEEIRAHEFHYYDTSDNGDTCLLTKPSGKSWTGIQVYKNVFAGFAHLYYPSRPEMIARFLAL